MCVSVCEYVSVCVCINLYVKMWLHVDFDVGGGWANVDVACVRMPQCN